MFIPKFKKSNNQIVKRFKSNKIGFGTGFLIKGNYGLMSLSYMMVTYKQLEAVRRYISRRVSKKSSKLHRVCLTHALFKKSSKSRMGKGKGKFYRWYGYIRPGTILFEFSILLSSYEEVKKNFRTIQTKLPLKCKLVHRNWFYKIGDRFD